MAKGIKWKRSFSNRLSYLQSLRWPFRVGKNRYNIWHKHCACCGRQGNLSLESTAGIRRTRRLQNVPPPRSRQLAAGATLEIPCRTGISSAGQTRKERDPMQCPIILVLRTRCNIRSIRGTRNTGDSGGRTGVGLPAIASWKSKNAKSACFTCTQCPAYASKRHPSWSVADTKHSRPSYAAKASRHLHHRHAESDRVPAFHHRYTNGKDWSAKPAFPCSTWPGLWFLCNRFKKLWNAAWIVRTFHQKTKELQTLKTYTQPQSSGMRTEGIINISPIHKKVSPLPENNTMRHLQALGA